MTEQLVSSLVKQSYQVSGERKPKDIMALTNSLPDGETEAQRDDVTCSR